MVGIPKIPKIPNFIPKAFPNRSNPCISIIPTGNMVGNSLGMGSWLGMVGIPKIPKLIPNQDPKKNIYKTEDYGRQNF